MIPEERVALFKTNRESGGMDQGSISPQGSLCIPEKRGLIPTFPISRQGEQTYYKIDCNQKN